MHYKHIKKHFNFTNHFSVPKRKATTNRSFQMDITPVMETTSVGWRQENTLSEEKMLIGLELFSQSIWTGDGNAKPQWKQRDKTSHSFCGLFIDIPLTPI